jgi:hypothetical protein
MTTTPEQADELSDIVGAHTGRELREAIAFRCMVAVLAGVAVHLAAVLLLPWIVRSIVRYVRWERADYRLSRYDAALERVPDEDLRRSVRAGG